MMQHKVLGFCLLSALVAGCDANAPTDPDDPPDDSPADPPADPPPAVGTEVVVTTYPADVLSRDGGSVHVGFVAIQDGDGPWRALTGTGGVYRARITNRRYGVALGCKGHALGSFTESGIGISYYTTDETTAPLDYSCFVSAAPRTITGTITGELAGNLAQVQVDSLNRVTPDADGRFQVSTRTGRMAVFGLARPPGNTPSNPTLMVRAPDIDTATTASVRVDFSRAVAITSYPLTIPSRPGFVAVRSGVRTNGALYAQMDGTTTSYRAAPSSLLLPGDLLRLTATHSDLSSYEISTTYLGQARAASLDFGKPLAADTTTVARAGRRVPVFTFTAAGATFSTAFYAGNASTSLGTESRSSYVRFSRAWLGGDREVSYTFPDLSNIPGWEASMELHPDIELSWEISRNEYSSAAVSDGQVSYSVGRYGMIVN